jgi:alkanesulfonate monooxygenase SsuD/methylene tetrahydromethanopterin reductase-like flavin-dependent oxidoreductase (luciferase family)
MSRLGLALSTPLLHNDMVRVVQECENLELDSFWLAEGLGKDAFAQLGALAPQTSRITLGTGIINIYTRSATLVSMAAAALNDITSGRFVLGLGTAHKRPTEERHSTPFIMPFQRMRDYISIIRPALAGKSVTYQGKAYAVKDLKLHFPAPQGKVPIYMAVLRPGMARLAGEVADGVILHYVSKSHIKRLKEAIAEGAISAGRDPSEIVVACFVICNASRDLQHARRQVANSVAYYGSMYFYRELLRMMGFEEEANAFADAWHRNDGDSAIEAVSPRLWDELSIAAGYEDIPRKIEMLRNAGVDLPIIYPTTDLQGTTESVLLALQSATAS